MLSRIHFIQMHPSSWAFAVFQSLVKESQRTRLVSVFDIDKLFQWTLEGLWGLFRGNGPVCLPTKSQSSPLVSWLRGLIGIYICINSGTHDPACVRPGRLINKGCCFTLFTMCFGKWDSGGPNLLRTLRDRRLLVRHWTPAWSPASGAGLTPRSHKRCTCPLGQGQPIQTCVTYTLIRIRLNELEEVNNKWSGL